MKTVSLWLYLCDTIVQSRNSFSSLTVPRGLRIESGVKTKKGRAFYSACCSQLDEQASLMYQQW